MSQQLLSIGKLAARPDAGRYYVDALAEGREDYYAGELETSGEWFGGGAAQLELPNQVGQEGLVRLLARHPASGTQLRSPLVEGAVAGFDLAFKAPKSVSILFGIAEPDVTREVILAHEAAVAEAMGYLERAECGAATAARSPCALAASSPLRSGTTRPAPATRYCTRMSSSATSREETTGAGARSTAAYCTGTREPQASSTTRCCEPS